MSYYALILGICVAAALTISGILVLARRSFPHRLDTGTQQVVGWAFSFVVTVYAFMVGFAIMNLWQMHNEAASAVSREVNELRTVFRLSREMDGSEKLRQLIPLYAQSVYEDEWPRMKKGTTSAKASALKNQVWDETQRLIKHNASNQVVSSALLQSLIDFNKNRRIRVLMISGHLHPLLLIGLAAGGLSTIFGFYYLSLKHSVVQVSLDVILIGSILLNLYIVYALNKPFSDSGASVSDEPFRALHQEIVEEGTSVPDHSEAGKGS